MKISPFSETDQPDLTSIHGALRVLAIVFFLNLILCIGKLATGLAVNSLAMLADGFHSLFDAMANIVGLLSLFISSKPADTDHPYGHRKFEVLAALAIAVFMGVTCLEILESAYRKLQGPLVTPSPNLFSFFVMAFTMAANTWCAWFEGKKARKYQSSILEADSAHTFSDVLSSVSVLVALTSARLGLGWVDLAASVLVALVVGWAAWKIAEKAVWALSDRAMVDPAAVASVVKSVPGVISCYKVRSRGMPGNIFVDMHVQVSPKLTTLKSHALSHQVMATVKDAIAGVKEVYVHTEPVKPGTNFPTSFEI